jgi:OmpA-like transmembrane domain
MEIFMPLKLSAALTAGLLLIAAQVSQAAEDTLGLYLGGSLGDAMQQFDPSTFSVHGDTTGYKFALGWRPLPVVAAELDYTDFGRAYGGINYADTDGLGLFALGFLPIPVVDVFGKVGVVNWRTDANSPFYGFHRTGSDLGYGFGAGTSWGTIGVRVEYERYEVSHASDMGLASVGLVWTFL